MDLKYYLHNIGSNLQSYINSQDWSQALKNAFLNKYNTYKTALLELLDTNSGRFSTDDSGTIVDSSNLLTGNDDTILMDENGNTYNSYDEVPEDLQDSIVEFSPTQEVNNYLSTIGLAIVESGKTRKTSDSNGDFDLNKDGFLRYWTDKINPAGGNPDISVYLDLDPVSPEGKRERTNRTKYLSHLLTQYLRKILSSKSNFSNTTFKTKDAYIARIQLAINNLNNGWDLTDASTLLAIGITPDFYDSFMTDLAKPLMSDEEVSAEMEKNKINAASDYIENVKKQYDNYASKYHIYSDEGEKLTINSDAKYNPDTAGCAGRISFALANLGYSISETDPTTVSNSVDDLWNRIKAALRAGNRNVTTPIGERLLSDIVPIILPTILKMGYFKDSESEPGVLYLDDPDNDSLYGAVLCLKDNKLYYTFIGNVKKSTAWQNLKASFDKTYVVKKDGPKYTFDKLGGVLRKLQEGGGIDTSDIDQETLAQLQALSNAMRQSESTENSQKTTAKNDGSISYIEGATAGEAVAAALFGSREAAAKAKGLSLERYNQKLRTPNGQPDFFNKDNGVWKTEDYLRLGAIAADIASLIMDPVSGAVTNVGSTVTNFMADRADNSVTAEEMWKNLGMNLGMDALSIVPIIGDAAGTGGKLIKSVKAIAPKLMYGLTAWGILGTLKNGSNIIESFNKVMSDEKLTVGDWLNIAQAITAVAGINGAVKSGMAKKLAKNQSKVEDAIGLGLKNKTTGKVLDHIFYGKHAKEIKDIIGDGNVSSENIGKLNEKINSLEGFSDYEINTNLSSKPVGTHLPFGRTTDADGKKHWGAQNPFSVERKIDFFDVYDPAKLRKGYASRTLLNTGRLDAVDASNIYSKDALKTAEEVDLITQHKLNESAADAISLRDKLNAKKSLLEESLNGVTKEDGTVVKGKKQQLSELTDDFENNVKPKILRNSVVRRNLRKLFRISDTDRSNKKLIAAIEGSTSNIGGVVRNHAEVELRITDIQGLLGRRLKKSDRTALEQEKRELENWLNNYENNLNVAKQIDKETGKSLTTLKSQYNSQIQLLTSEVDKLTKALNAYNNPPTNADGTVRKSRAYQKLLEELGPSLEIEWAPGKRRSVAQMLRDLNLYRNGGHLLFLQNGSIIKAEHGTQIKSGRWYTDIFLPIKTKILTYIRNGGAEDLNSHQNTHYDLNTKAGNFRKDAYKGENNSVKNYQDWWALHGFNTGVDANFYTRYGFEPGTKRTSGDNPEKHISDNLFSSIADDKRPLGRDGDFTDEELQNFNNELKELNYLMELQSNGYYTLKSLAANTTATPTSNTEFGTDPGLVTIPLKSNKKPIGKKSKTSATSSNGFDMETLANIAPYAMDLFRYKLLDNANKANALKAMEAVTPYYLTPQEDNVYVHGDLNALMLGEKKKADLLSIGYNHPVTSDANKQMAFIKDLAVKGNEYVDAGNEVDNEARKTSLQKDLEQRIKNHTSEHLVGEANRLAGLLAMQNKEKIRQAYAALHNYDRDALLQGFSSRIQTKLNEKVAGDLEAKVAYMLSAVTNNPAKYGVNLNNQERSVYNKFRTGTAPASMTDTERNYLASALGKIDLAIKQLYYKIRGIGDNEYTKDAAKFPKVKKTFTPNLMQVAKKGTKLEVAKLRQRAKNMDRLQRSLEKKMSSLDKLLDRISRSMYGLPKLEIVKSK